MAKSRVEHYAEGKTGPGIGTSGDAHSADEKLAVALKEAGYNKKNPKKKKKK